MQIKKSPRNTFKNQKTTTPKTTFWISSILTNKPRQHTGVATNGGQVHCSEAVIAVQVIYKQQPLRGGKTLQ